MPGESFARRMTRSRGGELVRGRQLILCQAEWLEAELIDCLDEVNSKRSRLGPGDKCTRALK